MSQRITLAFLTICVCVQISVGQIAYFQNDNPFASGAAGTAPSFWQVFGSSAPLNKENDFQIRNQPNTFFYQAPFPSSGLSTATASNSEMYPIINPSPVEMFVTKLNSTVYASTILSEIFDFRELSAEAFSKSLYDYVYACAVNVNHSDPHHIATVAAMPLKEGIDSYTLPIMLDIYGNSIAKYLFAKGTLNSDNACSLAQQYAKIVEETAERNWVKEIPESKFLVLEISFKNYMRSVNHFSIDTVEDLAIFYANEIKRVAKNYNKNSL